MGLNEVLASDTGIALIGAVAGGLWALFKGSAWFEALRRRKYRRALELIEAAVEETYRTYVAEIKRAREDGKLTAEEQAHARELARERALSIARNEGLDLLNTIGKDCIDLWIARAVKALKGK